MCIHYVLLKILHNVYCPFDVDRRLLLPPELCQLLGCPDRITGLSAIQLVPCERVDFPPQFFIVDIDSIPFSQHHRWRRRRRECRHRPGRLWIQRRPDGHCILCGQPGL